MRYFLCLLVSLAWGLWFGGLVMMFLFINRLFETLKAMDLRDVFDRVGPGQFAMSDRFELVVGMFALLATAALWFTSARRRAVTGAFIAFALTAAIAIFKGTWLTPTMLKLIQPGQAPTAQFMKLHGLSMGLGMLEVVLLLVVAATLPAAFVNAALSSVPNRAGAA